MTNEIIEYRFGGGETGLIKKLNFIGDVINKNARLSSVRDRALYITLGVENFDFYGQLEKIYSWVANNIRYVRDPENAELIQDADEVIAKGAGDCDDFAILIGALLKSIGFQIRLIISGRDAGGWNHIYLHALVSNEWIPCDPSMQYPLGKETDAQYKRYFVVLKN